MEVKIKTIGKTSLRQGYRIILDKEYLEGLKGLEGFSHAVVLWYADRMPENASCPMVLDKPYRNGPGQIGVFATRSPFRPNNLCISVARILAIDEANGILEVDWLDTLEGTPVFDIKPYHPSEDLVREAKVPAWCSHWPSCREESGTFNWEDEFLF
jgi:tRNA-Thr(GGU) m(6)t(6)A37 methyltransferase TsaA